MSGKELLKSRLLARAKSGNLRELPGPSKGVDFFSNDYLGLSTNKALIKAVDQSYADLPERWLGATGSRLLSGNSEYCEDLERELADFFSAQSALIFNSGYNANTSLLHSLAGKGDTILMDELCHASIKEGARLSFAKKISFKHNSLESLQQKLKHCEGNVFVVVESVYSMDGDMCPLFELNRFCSENSLNLILDEAHSTGVYDNQGRGLAVDCGLQNEIFARVYTFGKALGAHGAVVVGSEELRNYLINFGMSYVYTTALPLHSLVNIREAIRYQGRQFDQRDKLFDIIKYYRSVSHTLIGVIDSSSPIQAIEIPGNDNVAKVAKSLQEKGILVKPIKSPTVKEGHERLRICLHSFNTREDVNMLISEIKNLI